MSHLFNPMLQKYFFFYDLKADQGKGSLSVVIIMAHTTVGCWVPQRLTSILNQSHLNVFAVRVFMLKEGGLVPPPLLSCNLREAKPEKI